jgi:hypothetical protein
MEIFEKKDSDGEQSLSEGESGAQLVRPPNQVPLRGFAWKSRGSLNNFLALFSRSISFSELHFVRRGHVRHRPIGLAQVGRASARRAIVN